MEENNKAKSFMVKLSTFIVDKRNLFFLIFAILIIFSMFSRNWGEVEKRPYGISPRWNGSEFPAWYDLLR